jgi:hypothetical protein
LRLQRQLQGVPREGTSCRQLQPQLQRQLQQLVLQQATRCSWGVLSGRVTEGPVLLLLQLQQLLLVRLKSSRKCLLLQQLQRQVLLAAPLLQTWRWWQLWSSMQLQ